MPLTSPPPVRIGDDPTWHPTSFDATTYPEQVQRGHERLDPAGVEYQHWTVRLSDDEPTQVVRLRCAGPDATAAERQAVPGVHPAAVVVPRGTHPTTLKIVTSGEVILRPGDKPLVCG